MCLCTPRPRWSRSARQSSRAANSGVWFLPIYLGPMLAMILAWMVVRKMIRIAKTYRITSIADFIGSRYGKSPLLAGLVTLITVVGIVPYIALQLKAIASGYAVLTSPLGMPAVQSADWWSDSTLYVALALAGFTVAFGTRHLDTTERHEGMVAAIAFESVVKLVAFLTVGFFVVYGLFDGLVFRQIRAKPDRQQDRVARVALVAIVEPFVEQPVHVVLFQPIGQGELVIPRRWAGDDAAEHRTRRMHPGLVGRASVGRRR